MYSAPLKLLLLATLVLPGGAAMAYDNDAPVVWERSAALASTANMNLESTTRSMVNLTIAGANLDLLNLLETTRTRPDWTEPARDAAILAYTEALRDLSQATVDRDILNYLKAYAPNTLVAHEDHPGGLVPLFNVRRAASGVENGWKRQEALLEGLALLRSNPQSLADAFAIDNDTAVREGYRHALQQAQPEMLASLNAAAATRLAVTPELTPLFAESASLSGDLAAHQAVIQSGHGAPVATMLRQFSRQADYADQRRLLLEALTAEPASNTNLVVAELAPELVGNATVDRALVHVLGDPGLGATAALALSRSTSPKTLAALKSLAQDGSGLAAARARLALELRLEHINEARL